MTIYVVILFSIICIFWRRFNYLYHSNYQKSYKLDNLLFWIIPVVYTLMAYFRHKNVGTDYAMYYGWFWDPQEVEPGFKFIYGIARTLDNPYLVPGISTAIFVIFMLLGFKRLKLEFTTAILFFVISYFSFYILNGMRQAVACSIIFYGLNFIKDQGMTKGNVIKLLLILFIAQLFHPSAVYMIIILGLYFLQSKPVGKKIFILAFILICIGYFTPIIKNMISPILSIFDFYTEKYQQNLDSFFVQNKEKGIIQFIPILVQLGFLYYYVFYNKQEKNHFSSWYYLLFLSLYSASGIEAIDRIQIYLTPSIILFYDTFIYWIAKRESRSKGQDLLIILLVILFWFLYFLLRLMQNTNGIVPYRLYWG